MPESASRPEPPSNEQAADQPSDADRRTAAAAAMTASIERLDELGLDAVEPAAAFLWS